MKPAHLTEYDLLKLDWIQILKDTIDMRPTSWWLPEHSQYPVKEWKNAGSELAFAVIKAMKKAKLIQ
jgi:hypothetical protein